MAFAVYPGSFDPITLGHLDIARRAATIFDDLVIAVYDRPLKNLLFSIEQRVALVKEAIADIPNIRVDTYSGLTVEYAGQIGARVIVRGLRAATDFEHEFQMAHINHRLLPQVEVICLMASEEHTFLSSSAVKEIAALGGPVGDMVPPVVERALRAVNATRRDR